MPLWETDLFILGMSVLHCTPSAWQIQFRVRFYRAHGVPDLLLENSKDSQLPHAKCGVKSRSTSWRARQRPVQVQIRRILGSCAVATHGKSARWRDREAARTLKMASLSWNRSFPDGAMSAETCTRKRRKEMPGSHRSRAQTRFPNRDRCSREGRKHQKQKCKL